MCWIRSAPATRTSEIKGRNTLSKSVVFSFDDGRADTYTIAWPVLKQYDMRGTVNVVTDFVLHPERYQEFASSGNRAVTVEQLREMQEYGMELACHGSTHSNTVEDILKNIAELKEMGLYQPPIGFASPHSELTVENSTAVRALVEDGTLAYIRSGLQVRREGLVYAGLTALERGIHSPYLYVALNRRNILPPPSRTSMHETGTLLLSAAVTCHTTVAQIRRLIEAMKDGESLILMFHSILRPGDTGYGADTWYWDADRLEALCAWLAQQPELTVRTTVELVINHAEG